MRREDGGRARPRTWAGGQVEPGLWSTSAGADMSVGGPGDRVGPSSGTIESVIDVQFQGSVRRSSSPKARSLNFQILVCS